MADKIAISSSQYPGSKSVSKFAARAWNDSCRICFCCGGDAHVVLGGIFAHCDIRAVYLLSWTGGRPQHVPYIDLILGPWGLESEPSNRLLITLAYRQQPEGGSFIRTDSEERLANSPIYCGRALAATAPLPATIAEELPQFVDAIVQSEPVINAILTSAACKNADGRG